MGNLQGIFSIIGPILLGGNIYFIKKLVDKIDISSTKGTEDRAAIVSLSKGVAEIFEQLKELRCDIRDLRRIEIEVAVLKDRANNKDQE